MGILILNSDGVPFLTCPHSRYGLDDETEDKEVTLVRHLDTEEGWRVGGLTWNSLDSRLVISPVAEHSDWCDHSAKILVYNVDR